MSGESYDADATDTWLVEASRQLDEPSGDIARLIANFGDSLPRLRRPGRALATDNPLVRVNDRVLKKLLATRVRTSVGRLVVHTELLGDGTGLDGVSIGLIARYRDDLPRSADLVREQVAAILAQVLGADVTERARGDIHVRWQDVYTREWLT